MGIFTEEERARQVRVLTYALYERIKHLEGRQMSLEIIEEILREAQAVGRIVPALIEMEMGDLSGQQPN